MALPPPAPSWCDASAANRALLAAVAQDWHHSPLARAHLQQTLAHPEVELTVLVSAYRYYFYNHDDAQALAMATTLRERIRMAQGWPPTWEELRPYLLAQPDNPMVRLYLSAHGAAGLVLARLGQLESARILAQQLQQMGAKEFGAEVLLGVLTAPPEED